MKRIKLIWLLFCCLFVLFNISCQKEFSCTNCADTNKPPTAVAGADQVITFPLNSVSLDGRGSADPDGTITGWSWSKISGPSSFTIAVSSAAQTTVANLVEGIYKFELVVTDNGGLSDKDTMQVIINPVVTTNQPPVANAGPDRIITLPVNSIALDGSGSNDPDNNITSYQWIKIAGPSSYAIANTGAVQTTVTNLEAGTYKFELEVTDAGSLSAKDTIQVIIYPLGMPNQPPIANAGPDRTITLPLNSVALDGSGSNDPDNNITSYQWIKIACPSSYTIANTGAVQTTVTSLEAGTYKFELKVTDAGGLSAKDTMQVIVNPAVNTNQPPVANAGPDRTINVRSLALDGTGSSDPDNNIINYQWRKVTGPVTPHSIPNPNAVQTTVTDLIAGTYSFELKVTDAGGLSSTDIVQITAEVPVSSNELILENRTWIFPWYNTVEVENFNFLIPSNALFKIFIKRDNNPAWIEVIPVSSDGSSPPGVVYEYFIETRPFGAGMYHLGSLYVFYYGLDVSDTPAIKITY